MPKGKDEKNLDKKDDKQTPKDDGDNTIPKHRFDEVNEELKDLRSWKKEVEEKQKKAEEEELKKSKEFETLATKRKEELEDVRAKYRKTSVQLAVEREAIKKGITDTEAAYKLVDQSGISVNDDGEITGVEEAIEDLVENRSYLVEGEKKPISTVGAGANPDKGDTDVVPLSWVREKWADVEWTRTEHEEYGGLTGEEYLNKLEDEGRIDPNS